ncbi:hypothetical protein EGH21_07810 [Halomicroarcula sp. F13]|uniref:Uncharacterized protein n=2 Tax=Haloarcula TaxID=2237 RepID=A0AAW4PP14_9EURY|nr:hypothetical protein [Halomicroarcula rubra]MBX0322931.1 hypothetical protein [Halomicroarcula rubra]
MTKTTRETLTERVQTELIAYLKSGRPIGQEQLVHALDKTGLQIQDLDRLLRIRFALSEPVQDYLSELHDRLRRVKTDSTVESEETRGEIRGAIDWGQTIRQRYSEHPGDTSRFVTRSATTEYQLPQNVLMKALLSIIAETARSELLEIDYQWRRDRWDDGNIQSFLRHYNRNVHLNRINADSDTRVTPKALDQARQSRQPLYYEAYDLYRLYERLLARDFDDDDAGRVLLESLSVPETATLFELAVIFELLNAFSEQAEVTLRSIERGSDAIAVMADSNWEYRIYHDNTGRLRFHEPVPENNSVQYIRQSRRALDRHRDIMDHDTRRSLYSGRPDIVIERYPMDQADGQPNHVILGEIKHTESRSTLSDGIYELMRYFEFAKPDPGHGGWDSSSYLLGRDDISLSGFIVSDGVAFEPEVSEVALQHLVYSWLGELSIDDLFVFN